MKEAWRNTTDRQICSALLFIVVVVMMVINGIWRLKDELYLQQQQQILQNSSGSDQQWQLAQLQSRIDITNSIMVVCLSVTVAILVGLLIAVVKDTVSNDHKSRPQAFQRAPSSSVSK